jgi:hypothetical protein
VEARRRLRAAEVSASIDPLQADRISAGQAPLPVAARDAHRKADGTAGDNAGRPAALVTDWDKDNLIAGMARAVAFLKPGESVDQRSLKRIAKAHRGEGIPSYSTVHRYLRLQYAEDS